MMSATPSPTASEDASVELQVQVFVVHTITTLGVGYFIARLAKSVCDGSTSDAQDTTRAVEAKGQKIIFWTSFITLCMFFWRSIHAHIAKRTCFTRISLREPSKNRRFCSRRQKGILSDD